MTNLLCSTVFGHKIYLREGDFITSCIQKKGQCLGIENVLINNLLKLIDEPIAFDIGANVGTHCIPMSMYSKQVYAFEPQPDNLALLKKTMSYNYISNMALCPFGLSNKDSREVLYVNLDGNNGSSTLVEDIASDFSQCKPLEVCLRKGDDFVIENNISQVDLIKIEVEGFEGCVVDGLEKTILRSRPFIIMEWTTEQAKRDFKRLDLMRNLFSDYTIKAVKDDRYMHRVRTRKKPLRFLRRFLYKITHGTRYLEFQSFGFDNKYISIFLYPMKSLMLLINLWSCAHHYQQFYASSYVRIF